MKEFGLVLEGGGAKGAYHIGALKALLENGYSFSAVVGTSIGALNAAIFAQDGLKTLEEFWHSVRISNIFDIDDDIAEKLSVDGIEKDTFGYILKLLMHPKKFVEISGNKMETYVKERIDADKLLNSKIKAGCVTYCVSKMEGVEKFVDEMEKEFIEDYFIASATYPLYGFYEFGGEKYIDGGVWDNMPINLVASKGYKNIIAIRTSNKERRRKIIYDDLNISYITPSEDLGSMIEFIPKKISRWEKVGYYDGLRFVKKYRGIKYYFETASDEEILKMVKNLPYQEMADDGLICGFFSRKKSANFKHFIDEIRDLSELDLSDSDYILYLIELLAACLKIERLKVYSFSEWIMIIKDKLVFNDYDDFASLTKAIKNGKLKKLLFYVANSLKVKNE